MIQFHPFTYLVMAATIISSIAGFYNRKFLEETVFSVVAIRKRSQIHRLLTSLLIHADWVHLLFNMFAFYSFGLALERAVGSLSGLLLYLVSGIFANLLVFFLKRNSFSYTALGASGAVNGVIFAVIILVPGSGVYIYPIPVPVPGWLFAIVYILFSFFAIRHKGLNIGHEAHLAGAFFGLCMAAAIRPAAAVANPLLFFGVLALLTVMFTVLIAFPRLLAGNE